MTFYVLAYVTLGLIALSFIAGCAMRIKNDVARIRQILEKEIGKLE